MATYGPEDLASRELSCPICFEDYNSQNTERIPKLLPCLHTFCSDCTRKLWKNNGSIECSMCRMLHEEVKLDDLLDNYVIVEHLRQELEKRDHELAVRIDQGLCDVDVSISSRLSRPSSRGSASSRHSGTSSRHSGTSSRHSGTSSRHSSASSRHSSASSRHSSASSRHSSASSRHSSASSWLSSARSLHSSGSSWHSSASSRHSSASSSHSDASSRLGAASSRLGAASSRLRAASSRLCAARSRLCAARSRLRTASSRLRGASSRLRGASSRLRGASSRLSGASSRLSGASNRHSDTSNRHNGASSKHSSASSKHSDASKRHSSSRHSSASSRYSSNSSDSNISFTSIHSSSNVSKPQKKRITTTTMTRDAEFAWPVVQHTTVKHKATRHRPTPSTPQTVCIQPTKKRQRQEFLYCSSRQEPSTSYASSPRPPPRKCKKTRRFSKFPINPEEWTKIHHSIVSIQATVKQVTAAIQQRAHAKQHACSTAVSHFRSHNS